METVTRFSISVNSELLKKYDFLLKKIGYSNRSEAIRDLIRERLAQEEWQDSQKKSSPFYLLFIIIKQEN